MLFTQFLFSQKVGVVLSGGGAKGMAHIGVLKALEENNIPIDYIAGTSIGAIIAGLYSIGYSPEDMEELFKTEEFNNWAFGIIEEKYLYYFKEDEPSASWVKLDFSYDSILKPKLPTNIVPPYQMDFAFLEIFSAAAAQANYNFDSLFIPFRCLAADVHKNEEIVFRNGMLPSAIRASMTFPFYFKPITIDNRLLFDGGILNNFPVDVMEKDFKPDFIIGSKVSSNSDKPGEDDIMLQIENMVTLINTNFNIPKEKGVLIEPIVNNVGLMDFDKVDELVKNGYFEASYKINEILTKVKRRVSRLDVEKKRKEYKNDLPEIVIKNISVKGLNFRQQVYVLRSLYHNKKALTLESLKKEYFKLVADNKIESIYPVLKQDSASGYFDLSLKIKQKKKFEVQFGGNISSSPINQAYFGAKYHYLDKQSYETSANLYFGRLYSSVKLKSRMDFPSSLPFFVDVSATFNRWDYFRSYSGLFFEDTRPSYLISNESNFKSNIGMPVGNKSRIIFSGAIANMTDNYYQTKYYLKTDTTDKTIFDLYTFNAKFEKRTINYKQYGNKGSYFKLNARFVDGKEKHFPGSASVYKNISSQNHNWYNVSSIYFHYFKTNGFFTPGVYFEGVYSNQPFFSNYTSTLLISPSFSPVPHSKTLFLENYRAHSYAAGGINCVFNITNRLDLRLEAYVFQPYQKILKDEDLNPYYAEPFEYRYYMTSSSLIYHTPVGPASFSFNYYEGADNPYFFFFNFGYILFNKRALD